MKYLQIRDDNRDVILELFNKAVDKDGFIIEKKNGRRIECPYSKGPIKVNDFSILPDGSATFVNNKPYCFAEHRVSHKQ